MSHFTTSTGVKINYEESGNPAGRPVMVMHGWLCNLSTVKSIADSLPELRVINVDLPGHGQSSEPPLLSDGRPWGVEEYADAICELAEALGLEKPDLVGHSYGGRVAIVMGSRQKAGKIVLVDAAGIKPKRPLRYYIKVYSFKVQKKLANLFLGKKRAAAFIEKKRNKAGSADYRNSSPVMKMVMSRSVNQDLRHLMPGIKSPTLLVWGENDTATPLSDAKLMEKLIPDAGLVTFKGAGHYSFLDDPGRFKAVIRSFLID